MVRAMAGGGVDRIRILSTERGGSPDTAPGERSNLPPFSTSQDVPVEPPAQPYLTVSSPAACARHKADLANLATV
jgi:hypothetical protein